MYRRYIIVGIVFFLLIGSYFIFFNKKDNSEQYEKYYNKLVEREEFTNYLDDVNLSIKEIEEDDSKYTYTITFDGVTSTKSNIKILVLDERCSKDKIDNFPSFGIIDNEGYSLVKAGNEDVENKLLKGINLIAIKREKIDYFIIYFSNDNNEQFAKLKVSDFLN